MRALILAAALGAACLPPASAQLVEPEGPGGSGAPGGDVEEGLGLIERGVQEMLRGLFEEAAPAMRDAERALGMLEGMVGRLDDYQAPEILPNGDILIRRRPDAGPLPGGGDEIEL